MVYENNNNRIHWLTISLNAIPDILIAIIIAVVMDGGFLIFLTIFFALQLIHPLMWFKTALAKWLLLKSPGYVASDAGKWVYLRANGYPEPDNHEHSAEHYLSSIIENVSLPDDVRLKAAFDLGAIKTMSANGEVRSSQSASYENALAQSKEVFSKKAG